MALLKILGGLLLLFGVIDVIAVRFFERDLTGVAWSPLAAWLLGVILVKTGSAGMARRLESAAAAPDTALLGEQARSRQEPANPT